MKKRLMLIEFILPLLAYADITGRVSCSGKPSVGVLVSNGYTMIRTDRDGKFSLADHPNQRHVFICVPSEFRSVGKFYRPINNASQRYDFTLASSPGLPRRFVQLTDQEVNGGSAELPWMKAVRHYLQYQPAAFVISTGDLSSNTCAGLDFIARMLTPDKFATEMYFTIGNHDFTEERPSDECYRRNFGPPWYSFDSGGMHFAITPMIWSGRGQTKSRPVAYTTAEFLAWLRLDLLAQPPGTPIVLFNHDCWLYDPDIRKVLSLEQFNIKAYICGHTHHSKKSTVAGIKVYSTSCLSKGGESSPPALSVFEFDQDGNLHRELVHADIEPEIHALAIGQTILVTILKTSAPVKRVSAKDIEFVRHNFLSYFCNVSDHPKQVMVELADGQKLTLPITANPRLKWVSPGIGGTHIHAEPLLTENLVFGFASDEAEAALCGVSAYAQNSGQILWRFPTENSLKGTFSLVNDALAVCDLNENLYLIDLKTGKLRWKKSLRPDFPAYYSHGVAVLGNMIFAGENATLGAYHVNDGSLIWQGVLPDNDNRGVGFNHTIAGNKLLTNNQFLFNCAAFDVTNGKLLWIQGKGKGTIYNSPIFDGKDWYICLRDDILARIDLDSGKILETLKMARGFNLLRSRPVFQGNRLISGSRLQGVTFHDPIGKATMSFYKTGPTSLPFAPYVKYNDSTVEGNFIISGKLVFCASGDGHIVAFPSGSQIPCWDVNIGEPVTGIAVADDRLYAAGYSGWMYCLDISPDHK